MNRRTLFASLSAALAAPSSVLQAATAAPKPKVVTLFLKATGIPIFSCRLEGACSIKPCKSVIHPHRTNLLLVFDQNENVIGFCVAEDLVRIAWSDEEAEIYKRSLLNKNL